MLRVGKIDQRVGRHTTEALVKGLDTEGVSMLRVGKIDQRVGRHTTEALVRSTA